MSVVEKPTLYTDQEAAAILRVSEFTVSRLRRSRKLSYTRVGSYMSAFQLLASELRYGLGERE